MESSMKLYVFLNFWIVSVCALCGPGQYAPAGGGACFSCMSGTYQSAAGDQNRCDGCEVGTFAHESGMSACIACPAGSFQYAAGSSQCMDCHAGTAQPAQGATACGNCMAGHAQEKEGALECVACKPGTYAWASMATGCEWCASGAYQPASQATTCLRCVAGTFQEEGGQSGCQTCGEGRMQPDMGATSCSLCARGTYQHGVGFTFCFACPPGTMNGVEGQASLFACVVCVAGTYGPDRGMTACLECDPGTFRGLAGGTGCHLCRAGTYEARHGSSECVPCPQGTYGFKTGAAQGGDCLPCPSGTYGPYAGASAASQCVSCGAGAFSTGQGLWSEDSCVECPAGTFAPVGSSGCADCQDGEFCPSGSSAAIPCVGLGLACNRTHLVGQVGFLPVLVGPGCAGALPCPRGTLCAQGGHEILAEFADQTHFVMFRDGDRQWSGCGANLSYGYARVDWPGLSSANETSSVLFRLKPAVCEAGTALLGEECMPCPAGSFLRETGALTHHACQSCASGKFASVSGSTECAECLEGSYQLSTGQSACLACGPGSFQAGQGASGCARCQPGFFQKRWGGTNCFPCPPETFQNASGATSCEPCDNRTEFSSAGDTRCSLCGQTPARPDACTLKPMPANTSGAFWISVTGADGRDDCAAMTDQPRRAGLEIMRARYLRLDAGASCRHTLKVLGVPDASQSSALLPSTRTSFSGWASIRVIPFNATFYPAMCKSEAFGVLFVAPVETGRNVTFEVWDPPEEHLLFRGGCKDELLDGGVGSCETRTFCPTMDVLVRVVLPDQRFGSGRVSVGSERECPPTGDWHVSLKLRKQYVPSFPGDELAFELQLQNLPDRLQAFRWEVQILPGFEFVSFVTGITAVQEITEAMALRVRADASGHVIVGGVLGVLTVRLSAAQTGTVRALHLPPDSLRVLLGSGLHWLDVPHACPIRGGFVTIPADHARCTTLIARVRRDWLVYWKGVQDAGKESFTEIEALGVYNTRETPRMVGASCLSLTPKTLEALSCRRIFARGPGTGSIRVAAHGLETLVSIRVMVPEDVQARVFLDGSGRPGRLQVVGRLFGRLLDITPFVLPDRPEESPVCPRGFVGNVSIGTPAMVQAVCPRQQHDPRTGLFLLPSRAWTRGCGYRVFIPELSSQRAEAWALTLASDGGLVPYFPGPLESGDRDRLVVTGANSVRLSSPGGLSPRCVTLTDGMGRWELPVMPAPPASLDVRLSTTTLVVQQDMLKLVPTQADLLEAWLVLADGSRLDATQRLQLRVSGNLGVRNNQGVLESLFEPGVANVTFLVPGYTCASTSLAVTIHVSSVASSWLDCARCPPMLATSTDPLSEAWPDLFMSAVPIDWFVVTRRLVDGGTHRQVESVQVQGVVVRQDRQAIWPQTTGSLRVTTAFTQNELSIPVIHRWTCSWTLLCNGRACDDAMLRLAPPGDGAAMAPFGYVTRLELWVELALCNGTLLRFQSLPGVWLFVNNEATTLAQVPLRPGKLTLQIRFEAVWEMPRLDTELELWVHGLESLRVDVARHLQQLHCSRRWSASPVSVSGVLSDGRQEEVAGAVLTADGFNLRLDPASNVVHAMGPGVGWVMATYANHSEVALVAISMDSILFTELSLDGLPEQWSASLEARRLMHALLLPTLAVGQEEGLLDLVVRWKTDPPGIIDVAPGGELVLLSDHHQPVTISGVIRSCQGASPRVVSRPIQVNVVPDRAWQVDFGQEAGAPLPQVAIGNRLSIPIFLFCVSPLLEYRAIVSIPGIGGVACTAGELPYSTCTVRDDWAVQFSGNFPASQRTGRLLVGTLEGRVLVDGLARLRVSVSVPGAPTTHEFTVRLGVGPVHSMLHLPNAVVPGLVAPETSAGWSAHVVSEISACCHVQASRFKSSIAHLVSPSFRIENVTLLPMGESIRLDDPRLRVEFDRLFLLYEQGLWTLDRLAQIVGQTTEIRLRYQKPEDPVAPCLETAITVNLVKQDSIVFEPAHALELRRLHCSGHFEGWAIQAFLLLDNGRRIQLTGTDLFSNAVVENQTVARVERVDESTLLVQGLSTGNTSLRLKAFRLTALLPLAVLDESAVLRSTRLPDPYVLEAVAGIPVPLNLSGILANGKELRDVSFLAGMVVADSAFFVDWDVAGLVARRNTHPLEASPRLTVTVPACGDAPALLVSSRLHVRLLVGLDPARPVDMAVEFSPASDGFDVTLSAERVWAFLVRYATPKDGVAMTCAPGLGMPVLADCVVESGSIILAGAFGAPRDGPIRLASISPIPPWACGHIEYFSGETATRLPILAGCFGSWQEGADAVPSSLPVADPATLARQYAAALAHPWDRRAMQETRFTLELLVGRQRLVDVRLYSNEFELSAMFGVADRFLVPDPYQTSIDVVFHTALLPVHPDGVEVPEGVMVPAKHVVDGWYAVQWIEAIPRLSLRVSYRVSTSTSREPWEHVVPEPLVTGRPLHECPRQAMDRASFLVVYAIPGPMPAGQNLACAAQVAPRRVVVSGPDSKGMFLVSLALESFVRIHRAHVAIMDRLAPQRKRRILRPDSDLAARLTGLVYINDTADPFAPCPQGTYYTRNGTYEKLPQHSVAGPDCHGMECVNGFVFLDAECVPATVPLNLVWVCVSAIGVLIALISCVLCALHMGRRIPQTQQDVDLISEPCTTDMSQRTPDFLDDDGTREFQNIVLGSYIDDYSRTMLWDDGIDMEEQDRQRQSPR